MTQEPQRESRNLSPVGFLLGGLIGFFVAGTIVALLLENGVGRNSFHWLSTEACASLAVALTGLWLTIKTFTYGLTPYLIYQSRPDTVSRMLLPGKRKIWRIELMNTGSGMAVFQKMLFSHSSKALTIGDLEARLVEQKLIAGKDYQFQHLSKGAALAPQGTLLFAEIAWKALAQFREIEVLVEYENGLGKRYQKRIQLTPK